MPNIANADSLIKINTNIQEINKNDWSKFITTHPKGSIFQSPEYYNVCEKSYIREPIVVSAEKGGRVVGVMMGVVQKEDIDFFQGLTTRTIVWGGPLAKEGDKTVKKKLLNSFNEIASKKSIYCQIRNLWEYSDGDLSIFKEHGFDYVRHYGITIDLEPDLETLWSNMKSDGRGSVRKAQKEDLQFRLVENKEQYFKIIGILRSLYDYLGLPLPDEEYFSALYDELIPKGYLKVFGIFLEDKLIAGSLELCYNNMIFDFYKGSNSDYLKKCPNDLLYWEIIKYGKKCNYDVFNMGGAGKPREEYGVRDHKLKFGSKLHHYGRFLNIYKPILYNLGKIGINYWDQIKKFIKN